MLLGSTEDILLMGSAKDMESLNGSMGRAMLENGVVAFGKGKESGREGKEIAITEIGSWERVKVLGYISLMEMSIRAIS